MDSAEFDLHRNAYCLRAPRGLSSNADALFDLMRTALRRCDTERALRRALNARRFVLRCRVPSSRGVLHCTRKLPALRLLTRSDRFAFFIRLAPGRWVRCFAPTTRSAIVWSPSSCSSSICRPSACHQLVAEFERLIAADLTHPALAAPLATGITGVSAYLAQDYVAADSLDLAVREYGPAPPADALRVAAQLAGALDFAAVVNITPRRAASARRAAVVRRHAADRHRRRARARAGRRRRAGPASVHRARTHGRRARGIAAPTCSASRR